MKESNLTREYITGKIIILCIILLLATLIGLRFLNVTISNIIYVDRGLFTVITSNGAVNITPEDILRTETTFAKAAFTGQPVELDKIYTKEGFIYFSSADPFYPAGQQLMNSAPDGDLSPLRHSPVDYSAIRPYTYAVGMTLKQIPLFFLFLSLQNLAIMVGGVALFVLIFPVRTPLLSGGE